MQKDLATRQSNSPVEFSMITINFSFVRSGFNWTKKAAELLSLSLESLWKDFCVFHSFADLRTLYAASYDSDRIVLYNSTAGLTYTLPGKRNEHPGDGMNDIFKSIYFSSKMQALLIRSGLFFLHTRNGKPPHSPGGWCGSLVNTETSRSWTSDPCSK